HDALPIYDGGRRQVPGSHRLRRGPGSKETDKGQQRQRHGRDVRPEHEACVRPLRRRDVRPLRDHNTMLVKTCTKCNSEVNDEEPENDFSPHCSSPSLKTVCQVKPASLQPVPRSEEHTSELQSRENLVCRL